MMAKTSADTMNTITTVNTILFSDVHLGSPMSRAYDLLCTLKEYRFKRLIIAGDMFEDLNFRNLTSSHWELLEHIGKISRRGVEVVWLEGNHDIKFFHFMAQLIGIPALKEHEWEVNGRKFIALHGHQFDSFITSNDYLGRLLAAFYTSLQRYVSSHFFDQMLFKFADNWMRMTEQIGEYAIAYAKKKNSDVIICGHTHFVYKLKQDNCEYINIGCWNNHPSYLYIIQEDGSADLKVIP
ncbi:MAG: UDP-2,3-diacylglucosamine diphosphatase [Elusimicrobia bacterium]|nr:UDP-2,3-diacylglucosamine diphosphatase [Elusimicrobiota bacterium]